MSVFFASPPTPLLVGEGSFCSLAFYGKILFVPLLLQGEGAGDEVFTENLLFLDSYGMHTYGCCT
jgi:hypothetical protein